MCYWLSIEASLLRPTDSVLQCYSDSCTVVEKISRNAWVSACWLILFKGLSCLICWTWFIFTKADYLMRVMIGDIQFFGIRCFVVACKSRDNNLNLPELCVSNYVAYKDYMYRSLQYPLAISIEVMFYDNIHKRVLSEYLPVTTLISGRKICTIFLFL